MKKDIGSSFYDYAKALAILNENLTSLGSSPHVDPKDGIRMKEVRTKVVDAIGELVGEYFSTGLPQYKKKV